MIAMYKKIKTYITKYLVIAIEKRAKLCYHVKKYRVKEMRVQVKKFLMMGLYFLFVIVCILVFFLFVPNIKKAFVFAMGIIAVAIFVMVVLFICEKKMKNKGVLFRTIKKIVSYEYIIFLVFAFFYIIVLLSSFVGETSGSFKINTDIFSNKNVMIIIPHQDDDILLVGGLIEEYAKNKSNVSVVFTTNGDADNIAEIRMNESIKVLGNLGIEKDKIYFLGFGNRWKEKEFENGFVKHIYNSPDENTVWTSVNDKTGTFGVKNIDCYSKDTYSRKNFLNSIKSVILDVRPEIIIAVDYDKHIDHKATSLFFDEAMGLILKENSNYKPVVYKAFAYGTAWTARNDFSDSLNLISTQKPAKSVWENSASGFSWSDRIRIPIGTDNLNRILTKNSVYKSLKSYASQNAAANSGRVLNGDKVFWERRTDSLLYNAKFFSEENEILSLNDFKIKDSNDISENSPALDGVCFEKRIDVKMKEKTNINSIVFYDHADIDANILGGYILFDDGSKVDFFELNKDGSKTEVNFEKKEVQNFSIYLTQYEGDCAGLTEIEAYNNEVFVEKEPDYLMAVDEQDNFVYNYWIEDGEVAEFQLYCFPNDKKISFEDIKITALPQSSGSYEVKDNKIYVSCDTNETIAFRLEYDSISTEFTVRNPNAFTKLWNKIMQRINWSYVNFYSVFNYL